MSKDTVRQRLSAEQRRDEIIRVTLDLAAVRGVDEVTTQDMATAMGVTQGAVFRHFHSKDAIWLAVMQWVREHLMAAVGRAAEQGRDPLDALERMFFAHIAFIAKHPAIPRVLVSEHLHGRSSALRNLIGEIMGSYEQKIADLLAAAKIQGLARPDLDEHAAATLYIGMIQGLVLQASIFRGKRKLANEAGKVFPVYLHAIRNHPTTGVSAA
ncbi:MAG TPA: TetR/AcrR family transcriptional regulator [Sulfuriferula sp.]|nr:TetR/AcrR family transcriptional regulator [Sulfuriferula sp.]